MSVGAAWEYQVVWLSRTRPPEPEPILVDHITDARQRIEAHRKAFKDQQAAEPARWWNQTMAAFKERTDKLNELGAEGWELVGPCEDLDEHIGRDEKNLRQGAAYIFKRRKTVS